MTLDSKPSFSNPNYLPPSTSNNSSESILTTIINSADKLKNESLIDSLTGCYNRNFLNDWEKNFDPNRSDGLVGFVFVDVNYLKKVNDTKGHEAGDNLIIKAANFLKSNFRKEDIVIRLGGDEFVVLCHNYKNDPNFKDNLPQKITERLNQKLELEKTTQKPDDISLSLAFGVAVYDSEKDHHNLEETIKRADDLMYQNKKESKAERQN